MARRRATEVQRVDEHVEHSLLMARYLARAHGLRPEGDEDPFGTAVMEMSDAELRELAQRNPRHPGSAPVLHWLDRAGAQATEGTA